MQVRRQSPLTTIFVLAGLETGLYLRSTPNAVFLLAVTFSSTVRSAAFVAHAGTNVSTYDSYIHSIWPVYSLWVALTVSDAARRRQTFSEWTRRRWLGLATLPTLVLPSLAALLLAAALHTAVASAEERLSWQSFGFAGVTALHWSALAFLCLAFPVSRTGLALLLVVLGWILPRALDPTNADVARLLRLFDATRHIGASSELHQPWWGGAADMTRILTLAFAAMLVRARWPRAS